MVFRPSVLEILELNLIEKRVGGRTSLHQRIDETFLWTPKISTAHPHKTKSKTGAGFEPDHSGIAATNHSHWKQPALLKTVTGGRPDVPPSINALASKSVDSEISTAHP